MATRVRTILLVIAWIAFATVVSSCTFREVKPELSAAPALKYTTIVLGDITVEDKTWEPLLPHFRKGVMQWVKEKKAFEAVADSPPATPSVSTITLTGRITEVDKGSLALRWLIGMGAGQAKVKGVFEIKDSGGQTLAKFQGRESYLGGAGMGGAGFVDMEDLTKRFGETVAEMTAKWSRGEPLE